MNQLSNIERTNPRNGRPRALRRLHRVPARLLGRRGDGGRAIRRVPAVAVARAEELGRDSIDIWNLGYKLDKYKYY